MCSSLRLLSIIQKRVAAAIVLNAIPLVSSSNGALLITWLLDTSNFPGRYRLLAPRFLPHLAHLCTHKLASLAVLKIINQRADPASSRLILDALFEPDTKVLDDILGARALFPFSSTYTLTDRRCTR